MRLYGRVNCIQQSSLIAQGLWWLLGSVHPDNKNKVSRGRVVLLRRNDLHAEVNPLVWRNAEARNSSRSSKDVVRDLEDRGFLRRMNRATCRFIRVFAVSMEYVESTIRAQGDVGGRGIARLRAVQTPEQIVRARWAASCGDSPTLVV